MAAQIKIQKVGVPREKDTGISLDTVSSADPSTPTADKLSPVGSAAMSSNNMPQGRRP